jgi:hypothetical protein
VKSLSLVLALALLLLATTSAQAQVPYVQRELQIQRELQQAPQQRVIYNSRTPLLPPEEYDHPYTGPSLKITVHTTEELREICYVYKQQWPNMKSPPVACTDRWPDGRCHVHMNSPEVLKSLGTSWDVILRHEIAHCNGWPGDTPTQDPRSIIPPPRT